MSDRIQVDEEALSALMDGELSEFELRRLLGRMSDDPELLATWERYNLARAVFQPEPLGLQIPSLSSSDSLCNRIMAAIEAEPAFDGTATGSSAANHSGAAEKVGTLSPSLWTSQIAKFAVAASVALAVFIGMQSVLNTPETPVVAERTAGQMIEEPSLLAGNVAGNNEQAQLIVDADAQQRLNEYIRSVSIPSRPESSETPYNVLFESPMLHPVSDLELVQEVERTNP